MKADPRLFTQPEEWALYEAIREANARADELLAKQDYLGYFKMLHEVLLTPEKE